MSAEPKRLGHILNNTNDLEQCGVDSNDENAQSQVRLTRNVRWFNNGTKRSNNLISY